MSSYKINPSILSADLAHLADDVSRVLSSGADNIHFDVMDNHYVPNLTFGPVVLESLRKSGITSNVDVHLMVEPVDSLIEAFAKAGASSIVFHPEASKNIHRSLSLIKSYGIQSGLAFNPATGIGVYKNILPLIDRVLIMSVNPGFGGQIFISETLDKIERFSHWISKVNDNILLEVDGGIKKSNIKAIADRGANAFVIGSAIFNSKDYKETITSMRRELF